MTDDSIPAERFPAFVEASIERLRGFYERMCWVDPTKHKPRKAVIANGKRYNHAADAALALRVSENAVKLTCQGHPCKYYRFEERKRGERYRRKVEVPFTARYAT
jgi:hypothetical protein